MKTFALVPTLLFLVPLALPTGAQTAEKAAFLQGEVDQKSVRRQTETLATQIQGLIDALTANGISGDDAKILQTTKTVLGNLSAQEMQRVIDSLHQAGETAGTRAGERQIISAYGDQQGIVEVFRQILKDYELRQAASEIPGKFKELTTRQVEVMMSTATAGSGQGGTTSQEMTTFQATIQQIVQTDQNALAKDVIAATQMLDKAAQDSTGDEGRAIEQAQDDLKSGKLQAALDAAAGDIEQGHLLQATGQQRIAAEELRKITRDLNPPTSLTEQLSDFVARLGKLIEEQKNLLGQTTVAADIQPTPPGLDGKEALIVYNTDALQQDMQPTSPVASGLVKEAIMPMQTARRFLAPNGISFAQAGSSEQEAVDKLLAAQKELNKDLAGAGTAEQEANKDIDQKLHDLKNKIAEAIQKQRSTTIRTFQANAASPPDTKALTQTATAQTTLQETTRSLQNDAEPLSFPAANALGEAVVAMSEAGQSLPDPSMAQPTADAQTTAERDLTKAYNIIDKAIAQTEQPATDPSQLQTAATEIEKARSDVNNAIADAQPESNPPQDSPQPPAGQDPTLKDAEKQLVQAQTDADKSATMPGLPEMARDAIGQAQQEIAQGYDTAHKGDAKGTADHAGAAQASLARAQAVVSVALAGMSANGKSMASSSQPGPSNTGAPMPGLSTFATQPPHRSDQRTPWGAKTLLGGGDNTKYVLHEMSGLGRAVVWRDRNPDSVVESERETSPQEYSPMIDQYMKNLSDDSSPSISE